MANILTAYYRPMPGGFCKRLFRAINALLAQGHTVHYLAVVPFPINHPACHFHRFPWPEGKTAGLLFWGVFHLFAPLLLVYIGYRGQISHLFAFGHTYSLIMQPLRLAKGIPLTLFLRADSIENHRIKGRPQIMLALDSLLEALAIAKVSLYGVSQSLTDRICSRHRYFKARRAGTLRNDIEKLPPASPLKKGYDLPLKMACVGILEKRKNQHMLLDVFARMRPNQAQLYFFGVGPDESELKQTATKKGMTGQVHFMGWVEPAQIWQEIDLLLMPSLHEGSPNALMEALAQGIPVLASDIPEHREILPRDSLIPPFAPESWLVRLQKNIQYPEEELNMTAALQRPYAQRLVFDWDNTICNCILGQ